MIYGSEIPFGEGQRQAKPGASTMNRMNAASTS
jgi:hypothetical protein